MLDNFDYNILKIIQKDNLTSQRDIGDKIGLSAAAVQRRIKKMKEQGIIEKNVAVIDRQKVGKQITILCEIFLENEKIENIDALRNELICVPEIQQCYYVTGETDFFLVIVVPSMSYYENLTRRLFFENTNVKRFQTKVVMNIAKNSLEIPIGRPGPG